MTPRIKIIGAKWLQQVEIQTATVYFARKLKGFQRKKVRIHIKLVKHMEEREKCRASAHQIYPKSYSIRIERSLSPLVMLRCLAHEMIHLNQWLVGKMVDIDNRSRVQWGSQVYSMPLRYRNQPWEKEAYRNDKQLAKSFIERYESRS